MIKKIILFSCLFVVALPLIALAAGDEACKAKKGFCTPVVDNALPACDVAANHAEYGLCLGDYTKGYQCCVPNSGGSTAGASGLLPAPGDSAHKTPPSGLPSNTNIGNYQINDLLKLGKNVSNWILGMVGSAALLMFIWGGFQWLTSQGESAKIAEGKKIMTAAVIGLVIVFSSYIMIKFVVVDVLNMSWEGGYVKSK
jgi:hypothetical protein